MANPEILGDPNTSSGIIWRLKDDDTPEAYDRLRRAAFEFLRVLEATGRVWMIRAMPRIESDWDIATGKRWAQCYMRFSAIPQEPIDPNRPFGFGESH